MKSVYVIVKKDLSVFETFNTLRLLCDEYGFVYNTLTKQGHSFWVDCWFIFKSQPKVKPNARTLFK